MFALVCKFNGVEYRNSKEFSTRKQAAAAARYYAKRSGLTVKVVNA